ncbi:MAG: DUF2892 domain-containing protein [Bacteroidia bacterium]
MKKNMGMTDRAVRIIVALVIAALFFTNIISGTLGVVLLVAGAVLALTSFVSFCPLYTLIGASTCKVKES